MRPATTESSRVRKIALFLPSLTAGGVAVVFLELARSLVERGHEVELVLCHDRSAFSDRLGEGVRVVFLEAEPNLVARWRAWRDSGASTRALALPILLAPSAPPSLPFLAAFTRYLDESRPDIVLSAKTHTNLVALWARRRAKWKPRLVVSEHTSLTVQVAHSPFWRWRHVVPLVRAAYPDADGIVTVSDGVGDDLAEAASLPRDSIRTIFNPANRPEIAKLAAEPFDHPFLQEGAPPVVLAVGRMRSQKDYPTLIAAFARLCERRAAPVNLLILGDGNLRPEIEAQVKSLGLEERVSMPGFTSNPFSAMARASVFVLSSAWEGLSNVLIEALACGCPIVSTDCPSGPSEVLAGGRYGELVPVGDPEAMCRAIDRTLEHPPARDLLRSRAEEFKPEPIVDAYLEVLDPA